MLSGGKIESFQVGREEALRWKMRMLSGGKKESFQVVSGEASRWRGSFPLEAGRS